MSYDFDRVIERRNTNSAKWDNVAEDTLPLWVADMDFAAPPAVLTALKEKVEHGVFGYPSNLNDYYSSIVQWYQDRYGWSILKEWLLYSPGVIPALNLIVTTFTEPGDKIAIQSPVYPPFFEAVQSNGRVLVNNPLVFDGEKYRMDLEGFKEILNGVKMLILSSPHNPVNRVWTKEELSELSKICLEHKILMVADEIHSDLIFAGYKHTPISSLSEEVSQNSIICSAPSKTFNLAGLQTAHVIIPNPELMAKYKETLKKLHLSTPNAMGMVATSAAYNEGKEWLDKLISYVEGNYNYLKEYLETKAPQIKVLPSEGTYLAWLDFRELGLTPPEVEKLLLSKAKVFLNQGYTYGKGGEGFVRINLATRRAVLKESLERIVLAVAGL